jgi:hypothetical protein
MCQIQLDSYQYVLAAASLCPQDTIYSFLLELFCVAADM